MLNLCWEKVYGSNLYHLYGVENLSKETNSNNNKEFPQIKKIVKLVGFQQRPVRHCSMRISSPQTAREGAPSEESICQKVHLHKLQSIDGTSLTTGREKQKEMTNTANEKNKRQGNIENREVSRELF